MKHIKSILLLLMFISCKERQNKLDFKFIQSGVNVPFTVSCSVLNSDEFFKRKHSLSIDDVNIIEEFEKHLKLLSIDSLQSDIDVRIQVVFSHDKVKDTICMGEFFNISINGVKMKDSKEFHSFVKKMIDYEYTIRHPITGEMIPIEDIKTN